MVEVVVEDPTNGHMEVKMMTERKRMRPTTIVKTRGEIILMISMIKKIEIKEEEVEDKDMEEDASVGNVLTTEKKGIENLNVLSVKEG